MGRWHRGEITKLASRSVRRPLRNLRDRTVIIYHGVIWFVNNFGGRLGWTPYVSVVGSVAVPRASRVDVCGTN